MSVRKSSRIKVPTVPFDSRCGVGRLSPDVFRRMSGQNGGFLQNELAEWK